MLLGVTAESPLAGGGLATAAPQPTGAPLDQPTIQPTPTYDPARPAWTILYYASAENGRASFVFDDLNEMEAAGATDQVRLVAQVDWPEGGPAGTAETVRYAIQPDADAAQLASQPVAALGEANLGDPAALADFLTWGMATYPANRYALVLGDFGGGWRGCCFDNTIGAAGASDHLTLPDLDEALAAAAKAAGSRFEVMAFSAGLMNQLDVLQVLVPYAAYAVASPSLMPGDGWDWQAVVTQLNAQPLADGRQLTGDMTTAFVNTQRQLAGDEFVTMAAVDLAQVPALAAAVETLALTLQSDPALYGALAANARRGAQRYGQAALDDAGAIAAVDLLHAAAILAETAPPGELQSAAAAVTSAIQSVVVGFDHGQGLPNGRGIALYWPASAAAADPLYAQVSRLPAWADYVAGATLDEVPLHLTVDGGPRSTVSIANPALMRLELIGQRVDEVALIADQEAADGRRVLRQYEAVQPAPFTLPGGTSAVMWRDGRHESLIVWDATAAYLSDAAGTGDFAVIRAVDPSPIGAQLAVGGLFRPGGGETATPATLVFDESSAASRRLWLTATGSDGAPLLGEAAAGEGDVFQPFIWFTQPDGALTPEPGASLLFDGGGTLARSTRPLPGGNYAVGVRSQPAGGPPAATTQPLLVDPATAAPGFRAFVDAAQNTQFLYPADWLPPVTQESVTFTSNISGTAQLQVRYYPGWTNDLAALQDEVLGTFGEVSILLQEDIQVGAEAPVAAVRTAYGYENTEQGARTGMFLTFLKNGVGYVVDMDAPRPQETATLAAIDTIAATWQFLPPRLGFGPQSWAVLNVGEFRLTYPAANSYQEFNNWHRFAADPQTFVAVRIQPATRTPAEAMTGLLQTAAEGVSGFTADEPRRLFYAGAVWEGNDFHYTDATGAIVSGLLLSRVDGASEIAVWAEAPDPAEAFIQTTALPTAASIERIAAPPSG